MYYKEFLRVRKALAIYLAIIGVLALASIALQGNADFVVAAGPGGTLHGHVAAHGSHIPIPLTLFFVIAGIGAAIFASIVGVGLAAENDGHLAVVWTLPVSRLGYGMRVFAIDAGAILLAFGFTLAASLAVVFAHGLQRLFVIEADTWPQLLRYMLYPLAWFGLAQALTASIRTCKAGAYSGFAWPVAFILIALLEAPLSGAWHTVIQALNYVNPVFYGSYASGAGANSDLLNLTWQVAVVGLSGIFIAGVVAALAQWRRLEA